MAQCGKMCVSSEADCGYNFSFQCLVPEYLQIKCSWFKTSLNIYEAYVFCTTDTFATKLDVIVLLLIIRPSANTVDLYMKSMLTITVTSIIWAYNRGYFAAQGDKPCYVPKTTDWEDCICFCVGALLLRSKRQEAESFVCQCTVIHVSQMRGRETSACVKNALAHVLQAPAEGPDQHVQREQWRCAARPGGAGSGQRRNPVHSGPLQIRGQHQHCRCCYRKSASSTWPSMSMLCSSNTACGS